uniref:Cytochrome P450 71D7 n=1 Tax=Aegilops tauschii TaxID=37682 RepID=R7WFI0_AEGTA
MAMQQLVCWLCAFLALLLLKLIKKRGARTTAPALKLPPSPSSLPFIHNLHHLLRSPIAHRAVADIARELDAPLMYLQLGELPAVFVSSADAAREMMKVHDMKFAWRPYPPTIQKLRPMGKGIFFAPYGALWRQLRKISIVKLLSVRRVHSFHRVREEEAGRLVAAIAATLPGDTRQKRKEAMAAPSTRNAVTGEEEDLMDELMRIHEEGSLWRRDGDVIRCTPMGDVRADEEPESDAESTGRAARQTPREAYRDRGRPGRHDLPEARRQGDPEAAPGAAIARPKGVQRECKIMGYDVPKGFVVFVNAWAIGRDPKFWDDPEEFKPERFENSTVDLKGTDFEFIPFGAGRRLCPGLAFGLASIEIVLAVLLYHFDWELPDGVAPSELDMTEEMGITIRRKNDLYLRPTVRIKV